MVPVYISSHGFGHMTRSLAIIERLLDTTSYEVCVVSGEPQVQFAMAYLAKFSTRVTYHATMTDIGLVNEEGSLVVDKTKLTNKLNRYISTFDTVVQAEVDFLKDKHVQCVLTDISCLGIDVAKALNVKSIAITNFTWLEQYTHLNLASNIIDFYKSKYSQLDYVYLYDLSTNELEEFVKDNNIEVLNDGGLVTRPIDFEKVQNLKSIYEKPIFISFGKSTDIDTINIDYDGSIISTPGTNLDVSGRHIELMQSTLDTHNFIAASELVISKAGWGTIAESLVAGVPLVLVERDGVLEDTHHINSLKADNLCISIKEEELKNLDLNKLRVETSALSRDAKHNNRKNVVKEILSVLK